jgi:hypothetical protein
MFEREVSQLGHDDHAYSDPNYLTLVGRSLQWAARRAPEDARWQTLFDGKSLAGWKPEGNARFSVEDGILVGRQGPKAEAEFADFELEVTWAMDWPGNSGIWFRYQSAERAYQADILEWKDPVAWSGTIYCSGKMFIARTLDSASVSRDGWHLFRIRAQKDRLEVFLNGRRVGEARDSSAPQGRIGIQVHAGAEFASSAVRIAEVRVRPLAPDG